MTNPKLILADEPTGNLDSKNGAEVMNLLTELNKEGTTVIMVTHSQHDASFAHRTVHLTSTYKPRDMRQLYYTLQTLLRGHGGTLEKLISLTLGLVMGVLLFAQIVYELSFDRFYPNPETLVMLRMREVRQGVPEREYNYGTYRPAAADLSEAFPELIKSACLTSNFWQPTIYKNDKKLEDIQTLFADTAYFQTTGLQLLQGTPKDLGVQGNAFISQRKARELYGDENPIGKELSIEKLFNVTIRGVYADIPGNSIMPHDLLLSMAAMAHGGRTISTVSCSA